MILPFRRRTFRRQPPTVQRTVTVEAEGNTIAGNQNLIVLANVVESIADVTNPADIPQGARLPKGMYLSFFIYNDESPVVATNIHLSYKMPGQDYGADIPNPGEVNQFAVGHKQIVHQWKGLPGATDNQVAGVPLVFVGTMAIPKKMRFSPLGWQLILRLNNATGISGKFCVQAIYKYDR